MRDAFEHNLGGGLYRSSMHMRSNANGDGLCTHYGDGFRPQIGSDCVSKFAHFVASAFEGVPKVGTDSVPRFGDENRPHNNETCFGYEKRPRFGGRISYLIRGRVCIRALAVESVYALLLGSPRDWFLGGRGVVAARLGARRHESSRGEQIRNPKARWIHAQCFYVLVF